MTPDKETDGMGVVALIGLIGNDSNRHHVRWVAPGGAQRTRDRVTSLWTAAEVSGVR